MNEQRLRYLGSIGVNIHKYEETRRLGILEYADAEKRFGRALTKDEWYAINDLRRENDCPPHIGDMDLDEFNDFTRQMTDATNRSGL